MMIRFIKKEAVLCVSALLAVISMFFVPPDRAYTGYINFRVLGLLFSLMAVVAGLRKLKVLDILARRLTARCNNMRSLVAVLVAMCFFSSMLITNDVALLTFVPLAIGVLTVAEGKRYIIYTVILQTVAANMGSMLTPMGNPQNLYLSDFYSMSTSEFFSVTVPVCLVSAVIILLMLTAVKKQGIPSVAEDTERVETDKRLLAMYIALGIFSLMAVFNVTEQLYIAVVVVTLAAVLACDRAVLGKIDWFLLLTFVMFFVFVGNVARIEAVRACLGELTSGREVLVGALSSQIISNVPAAVMLSTFTDNGKALLVGVDIGGLGTPVASLASLISYRLYAASEDSDKGKYMLMFLGINFALLLLMLCINALL